MNIIEELGAAKVVGITGHIRPDGDCTGSVLGLYNYLKDNAPDIDVNVIRAGGYYERAFRGC